jgi:SAM-dependent methyltransferase
MKPLTKKNDAFGREIWAYLTEGQSGEIVERDDRFITSGDGPLRYFANFARWPNPERQAMRFVRGTRALDVGCGAGRVALFLQSKGFSVTAIDNSPLAIRACRKRGVKDARLLPFERLDRFPPNLFDTVIMFGNNFGLFGSYTKAKRLLRQLHRITTAKAVVLGYSVDPYKTAIAAHMNYHRRNRRRGRMSGQLRIRVRFHDIIGPWFDYLIVSPDEMLTILEGTRWRRTRLFRDRGPGYAAVIEKE